MQKNDLITDIKPCLSIRVRGLPVPAPPSQKIPRVPRKHVPTDDICPYLKIASHKYFFYHSKRFEGTLVKPPLLKTDAPLCSS
jgi:hypothetical protein